MSKLRSGQKVYIHSELSDHTYEGTIYAIEPKINLQTRTITARAILNNEDHQIMPGAFVNVEIVLNTYPEAIQIPAVALIPELGGQKVYKYQQGKAVPVKVQTGIRSESEVQITEGLQAGDTLITSGLLNLRPNVGVNLLKVN